MSWTGAHILNWKIKIYPKTFSVYSNIKLNKNLLVAWETIHADAESYITSLSIVHFMYFYDRTIYITAVFMFPSEDFT